MVSGSRSRSVRMLAAVLFILAVVGAVSASASLLRPDDDAVVDVQPGLLDAYQRARGGILLGDGVTVSLYAAGLELRRYDTLLFRTARIASLVSTGSGSVTGQGAARQEHVASTLDNTRVTSVTVSRDTATYRGVVFDSSRSLPLTLTVRRLGEGAELSVDVPGADLVVLHGWGDPGARGVPPRLPAERLSGGAWWLGQAAAGPGAAHPVTGAAGRAYVSGLGSTVSVATTAPALVDARHPGRTEIHVWSPLLRLEVW